MLAKTFTAKIPLALKPEGPGIDAKAW